MKWDELNKGDALFLLVPNTNLETGEINYDYQESYVINIKKIYYKDTINISIRFKYTDSSGRRRRIEYLIPHWQLENECIVYEKHASWFNSNNWYGNLIICNDNPEQLNDVYHKLIEYKSKEIQMLIDSQKKLLKKLKINKTKNII